MKKLLLISFLVISSFSYSFDFFKPKEKDLVYLDYSYVVDNYSKTIEFNKVLKDAYTELTIKKKVINEILNVNEDDKEYKEYEKLKADLTQEVVNDVELAIAFVGHFKDYQIIITKSKCLYAKNKNVDISNEILDFLNNTFYNSFQSKDMQKFKNIDMLNLS